MGRNWERKSFGQWQWKFWAAYWYEETGIARTRLGARWASWRAAKAYWG